MLTNILRFCVVLFFIVSFASAAEAQVHIVDCATGPNFTIQDGINAAADGDVVAVFNCPNPYPGFTVNGRNNLQIVAADQANNVISAMPIGVTTTPNTNVPQILENNSSCVRITGSTNISIVGFLLEACGGSGFDIDGGSWRINLHGNQLYFAADHGVHVLNGRFIDITGNFLFGAQAAGIATEPGASYVSIEANQILFHAGDGVLMEGVGIDLTGNEIRMNGGDGVSLQSIFSRVSRNWVAGNGANEINFLNWTAPDENCVVGNWMAAAGIVPLAADLFGCHAENF